MRVALLFLIAGAIPPIYESPAPDRILRYYDRDTGVVCYVIHSRQDGNWKPVSPAISCVVAGVRGAR